MLLPGMLLLSITAMSKYFMDFTIHMSFQFMAGDILKYVRDGNFFSWYRVNYLHLQKVSPEELTPVHNHLKLMSDLRRKKLDLKRL